MENLAQRFTELTIGCRLWSSEVHWAMDTIFQQPYDRRHLVGEADPTHVLLTIAEAPTKAKPKQRQHLVEATTFAI